MTGTRDTTRQVIQRSAAVHNAEKAATSTPDGTPAQKARVVKLATLKTCGQLDGRGREGYVPWPLLQTLPQTVHGEAKFRLLPSPPSWLPRRPAFPPPWRLHFLHPLMHLLTQATALFPR